MGLVCQTAGKSGFSISSIASIPTIHHTALVWGYALCRSIIEAHRGRIWAENRKDGQGAIFAFTLPLEGKPPTLKNEPFD